MSETAAASYSGEDHDDVDDNDGGGTSVVAMTNKPQENAAAASAAAAAAASASAASNDANDEDDDLDQRLVTSNPPSSFLRQRVAVPHQSSTSVPGLLRYGTVVDCVEPLDDESDGETLWTIKFDFERASVEYDASELADALRLYRRGPTATTTVGEEEEGGGGVGPDVVRGRPRKKKRKDKKNDRLGLEDGANGGGGDEERRRMFNGNNDDDGQDEDNFSLGSYAVCFDECSFDSDIRRAVDDGGDFTGDVRCNGDAKEKRNAQRAKRKVPREVITSINDDDDDNNDDDDGDDDDDVDPPQPNWTCFRCDTENDGYRMKCHPCGAWKGGRRPKAPHGETARPSQESSQSDEAPAVPDNIPSNGAEGDEENEDEEQTLLANVANSICRNVKKNEGSRMPSDAELTARRDYWLGVTTTASSETGDAETEGETHEDATTSSDDEDEKGSSRATWVCFRCDVTNENNRLRCGQCGAWKNGCRPKWHQTRNRAAQRLDEETTKAIRAARLAVIGPTAAKGDEAERNDEAVKAVQAARLAVGLPQAAIPIPPPTTRRRRAAARETSGATAAQDGSFNSSNAGAEPDKAEWKCFKCRKTNPFYRQRCSKPCGAWRGGKRPKKKDTKQGRPTQRNGGLQVDWGGMTPFPMQSTWMFGALQRTQGANTMISTATGGMHPPTEFLHQPPHTAADSAQQHQQQTKKKRREFKTHGCFDIDQGSGERVFNVDAFLAVNNVNPTTQGYDASGASGAYGATNATAAAAAAEGDVPSRTWV